MAHNTLPALAKANEVIAHDAAARGLRDAPLSSPSVDFT